MVHEAPKGENPEEAGGTPGCGLVGARQMKTAVAMALVKLHLSHSDKKEGTAFLPRGVRA